MIIRAMAEHFFTRLLLLGAVVLLLTGTPGVKAQENNTDIVVENGTVILPITYGNEAPVTNLLQYLQGMPEFSNMTMVLLQPKGASAMVLFSCQVAK